MTLIRGISTLGCPELNLPEAAALADRFGFDRLELRALSGDCRLAAHLAEPVNREALKRLAPRVTLLGSGFGLSGDGGNFRELEELSEVADEFGIPFLRVFGGIPFEQPLDDEVIARTHAHLERFRKLARRCRLALETHDGYASARRTVELFERLGFPLPVVWDAHHTWAAGGETFAESYELIAPHLIEVHIKDSRSVNGKREGTLPGEGDVPVPELLKLLAAKQFPHPVIFEYEKLWEPALPPLPEALAAFNRNWLHD